MKNLNLSVRVTPDERELLLHFATAAHLSLSNYLRITALSRTSYHTTHVALSLKIGEASCLLESICEQESPNNQAIAHQLTELWAIVEEVTAIAHQLME
jgi:hypothetical protein